MIGTGQAPRAAVTGRGPQALRCKPLDVNHPCLMLLTFAKLLDFAQCCRGDVLLVASAANNHATNYPQLTPGQAHTVQLTK